MPRESGARLGALAAGGLANKEIATRLHLSLSTIETTLSNVYAKLGIRSRTELSARFNDPKPT